MNSCKDIALELKEIRKQLDSIAKAQADIKKEIRMIFCDVTHFENMVIKILDNKASNCLPYDRDKSKEEYQH